MSKPKSYFAKYWVEKGLMIGGVKSSETCRYESLEDLNGRIETIKDFTPEAQIKICESNKEPEILTGNKLNRNLHGGRT